VFTPVLPQSTACRAELRCQAVRGTKGAFPQRYFKKVHPSSFQIITHSIDFQKSLVIMEQPSRSKNVVEKPTMSPFDRLPIEILHMVFANLEPQDVTQMRLTCGLLADIGCYYLLSEVHLIFKSSSFERMRQISRHPIVSQTVKSLFYEAEVIQRCHDFNAWRRCNEYPAVLTDFAATHPRDRKSFAFLRRWRAQQDLPRPCSVKELRRAYANYNQYAANQQMIIRHDHNSDLIRDAIRRFPHLDTVHMVKERQMIDCSRYLVREFEAGLRIPHDRLVSQEACGVSQLLSVLLGAISAGRRLWRVTCDQVHWTFFAQRVDVLAKTRLAVEHLKILQLKISTCHENDDGDVYDIICANSHACTERLQHGALRDFIAAAPHLKDLNIGLNPVYGHLPPISLNNAVGTYHWRYLERITFANLSTREEDLLDFCDRHATNLTHLSISGLTLTSGCWQRVFQQIRKALCLRSVEVSGWLMSYDYEDEHNLVDLGEDLSPEVTRKPRIRVAIEAYILEGGDAEPMNLDPVLYESDDNDSRSNGTSSSGYTDSLDGFNFNTETGWKPRLDDIDYDLLEEEYFDSLNDDYGSI